MSGLSKLKKFAGSTHESKAFTAAVGQAKVKPVRVVVKAKRRVRALPFARGFEGGQTPLIRRMPKVGFSNQPFANRFEILNVNQLASFWVPSVLKNWPRRDLSAPLQRLRY